MSRFISYLVDDDITALVKKPTEAEFADLEMLQAKWSTICQQYAVLVGDTGPKAAAALAFEIEALNCRITSIYGALEVLQTYRVDELVSLLHKEGYRYPFNAEDLPSYYDNLNTVAVRARAIQAELETKVKLQEKMAEKNAGNTIDRDYFEAWLVVLSKFQGHSLNEKKITVSRFATIMKQYISHCEQLKKAHEKRPNR